MPYDILEDEAPATPGGYEILGDEPAETPGRGQTVSAPGQIVSGTLEGIANSFKRGNLAGQRSIEALQFQTETPTIKQGRRAFTGAMEDPRYMAELMGAEDPAKAESLFGPSARLRSAMGPAKESNIATAQNVADLTKQANAIPSSAAMQEWAQADNSNWWQVFARNPVEITANIFAESIPQAATGMAAGMAAGAAGGPIGAGVGAGVGSFTVEAANAFLEAAAKNGVNLEDPEQVRAFFSDEAKVKEAKRFAMTRGFPIALFDGLTAGVAGKFLKPALGKGMARVAGASAKELGTQMAGGAVGETAAQVASGQDISAKDIAAEAIGELATAPGEVFSNLRSEARGFEVLPEEGNSQNSEKPKEPVAPVATVPAGPVAPVADTSADALAELQAVLRGEAPGSQRLKGALPKVQPEPAGAVSSEPVVVEKRVEVPAALTEEQRAAVEFQRKTDEAVKAAVQNPDKNYEGMARDEVELLAGMGDARAIAERKARNKAAQDKFLDSLAQPKVPEVAEYAGTLEQRGDQTLLEAAKEAGGVNAPPLEDALRRMEAGETPGQVVKQWAQGGGEADALINVLEQLREAARRGRQFKEFQGLAAAYKSAFVESRRNKTDATINGLAAAKRETGLQVKLPESTNDLIDRVWGEVTGRKEAPELSRAEQGLYFADVIATNQGRTKGQGGSDARPTDSLQIGDKFRVRGEWAEVTGIDPDTEEVTVTFEDGGQFGRKQSIDPQQVREFYPDFGTFRRKPGAGQAGAASKDSPFSIAAAPAGWAEVTDTPRSSVPVERVRALAQAFRRELPGAPDVVVVQTGGELPPNILRRANGATPQAAIWYDSPNGPRVYVVADKMMSEERVRSVLAHEAVAHYGLKVVLGDQLNPFLDSVFDGYMATAKGRAALADTAERYRRVLENPDEPTVRDRRLIAEEIVAQVAEGRIDDAGLWGRIVAAVRRWWRQATGGDVTEQEIRDMLAKARERLRDGGAEETGDGARYSFEPFINQTGSYLFKDDTSSVSTAEEAGGPRGYQNAEDRFTTGAGAFERGLQKARMRKRLRDQRAGRGLNEITEGQSYPPYSEFARLMREADEAAGTRFALGDEQVSIAPKEFEKGWVHVNIRDQSLDLSKPITGWVLPVEGSDSPNAMNTRYGKAGLSAVFVPDKWVSYGGDKPATIKPGFYAKPNQVAVIQQNHIRPDSTVDWSGVFGVGDGARFALAPDERSENFKRWFGQSKVADNFGRPLPVYHSSPATFNAFDTSNEGAHFGSYEQAGNLKKVGKKVPKAFFLSIQNPLRLPDLGVWRDFNNVFSHLSRADILDAKEADQIWEEYRWTDERGWKALKNALRTKGFDGIVYENEEEGSGDSWIAFEPAQIKSATANRGTFDPKNPDVRFALGDDEGATQDAPRTTLRGQIEALGKEMDAFKDRGEAIPQAMLDEYKELVDTLGDEIRSGRANSGAGRIAVDQNLEESNGTRQRTGQTLRGIPQWKGAERLPGGRLKDLFTGLRAWRVKSGNWLARRGARESIVVNRDVADNRANQAGNEMSLHVRLTLNRSFGVKPKDVRMLKHPLRESALTFAVEADGERARLSDFYDQIGASEHADTKAGRQALAALEYAEANWDKLQPAAAEYKTLTETEREAELNEGVNSPEWKGGYVKHSWARDDVGAGADPTKPAAAGTPFRKPRSVATYAEGIAQGRKPTTLNALELLADRVAGGQRKLNELAWVHGLRNLLDPVTDMPAVVDVIKKPRKPANLPAEDSERAQAQDEAGITYKPDWVTIAPEGYTVWRFGELEVAVQENFVGLLNKLTAASFFKGSSVKKVFGFIKSSLLMFDTFHLGRMVAWRQMFGLGGGYQKGQTLLDFSAADIREMAARGEIPEAWAEGLQENKRRLDLALRTGFNVGNVLDNAWGDALHNLPVVGTFNHWLFGQYQRGAMTEAWLIEFERMSRALPNASEEQVARRVSKDLNARFGNLNRQGLFKSRTAQDLARFVFLAPQWNESLIRAELGAIVQTLKTPMESIQQRRLVVGTLMKATGAMALGTFLANQILNYAFRGKPTWENEEEGWDKKISAYLPDAVSGGPGFFLNPLALPMEYTHLIEGNLHRSGGDLSEALRRVAVSRLHAAARPAEMFLTRKDALGAKLRDGEVLPAMAKALIPIPIGAVSPATAAKQLISGEPSERFPGQYQKQMMASFGVKTDQAPSAEQRIRNLAREFNREKGIVPSAEFFTGDFDELNKALRIGNNTEARKALDELLLKKTPRQVFDHYKRVAAAPFTGQQAREKEFWRGLTEEQRSQYLKAREARKATAKKAAEMLKAVAK